MEQYISEALMLILGTFLGWFPNRKKQKVDTKEIEVQVLEKAIQVLNKDVVDPLRENMKLLQADNDKFLKQLKRLQHAINQMYKCRIVDTCPIRVELQKSERANRKGHDNRPPTYRARDSTDNERDKAGDDSTEDSEIESRS